MKPVLVFCAVIEGLGRDFPPGEPFPLRQHRGAVFPVNPAVDRADAAIGHGKQFRQHARTGNFPSGGIEHESRGSGNLRPGFQLGMGITQAVALRVLLGHIAERQNRAEYFAVRPEDRRGAVGDVIPGSVAGNQIGMIGEFDNHAGPQRPHHRRGARLVVVIRKI